jgi:type I restriction enzyme S subunit
MTENNNIPKHWQLKKLGEVCKLKNGYAFKSDKYENVGVPIIRISDINGGNVSSQKAVRVKGNVEYDNYLVEDNDILVAMSGATTGKFGIYKSTEKAYQNKRVGKFKIFDKRILDNQFLYYQINSLKRQIEKDAYGGAQPNISSTKIERMQIVLPPLPEQLTIVSKIEELFSELDNGIAQLKTAKQQLKVYRQSLLKWAFEGKLTSSITNEKLRSTNGELPKGWKLNELGNVSDMCLGKMLDKKKNKGNYQPYLRNISVRWGHFDLSDLEEMRFETHEEERYSLKNGDLIICEGGESGRCAIWKGIVPNMKIQKHCTGLELKIWFPRFICITICFMLQSQVY